MAEQNFDRWASEQRALLGTNAPAPAEPEVQFEDAIKKWARENNKRNSRRIVAKYRRKQEEQRIMERQQPQTDWNALTDFVDTRIAAALGERQRELVAMVETVANASAEFSNAVQLKVKELQSAINNANRENADLIRKVVALQAHVASLQVAVDAERSRFQDLKKDM